MFVRPSPLCTAIERKLINETRNAWRRSRLMSPNENLYAHTPHGVTNHLSIIHEQEKNC